MFLGSSSSTHPVSNQFIMLLKTLRGRQERDLLRSSRRKHRLCLWDNTGPTPRSSRSSASVFRERERKKSVLLSRVNMYSVVHRPLLMSCASRIPCQQPQLEGFHVPCTVNKGLQRHAAAYSDITQRRLCGLNSWNFWNIDGDTVTCFDFNGCFINATSSEKKTQRMFKNI